MFNELWIEIKGMDYMFDVSPNRDNSLCQLAIYKNPLAFHVFGVPMLRGYYTIHDPVNSKISFVPTPNSVKTRLQIGILPSNYLPAPVPQSFNTWIYVITAIITVMLACLYYFVLIPYLKRYISNQMLVVLAGTAIVGSIVASYVWGVLPKLKDAFGQQTEVSGLDSSSIVRVQASEGSEVWMLAAGLVGGIVLRSLFVSEKAAAGALPRQGQAVQSSDSETANALL